MYGEAAFLGHGLDDGLDPGPGLHGLVRSEVADVARAHGEDALAQQGEFLVHHALYHGGGEDAREVVVLEGRHEGQGARRDDELLSVHVEDFLRHDIFDCQALALEDVPDHAIEHDAFVGIACQRPGDVETAHSAEFLFLLKEEELVSLHLELAADGIVVVQHQIVDACLVQFFPHGEAGRSRADDGDGSAINLLGIGLARS